MNDDDIKNSSFEDVAKGITSAGKIRAAIFLGHKNGDLAGKLSDFSSGILRENPSSFLVTIDSQKVKTPFDWCSQFARSLRTTRAVKLADMAKFALDTGKSLSPFKKPSQDSANSPESSDNEIAQELVKNFEGLLKSATQAVASPHLVIVVKHLSDFSGDMLIWMTNAFNNAIRKSKAFQGARFVFSCETITDKEKSFFAQFGFEKIHSVEIDPPPQKTDSKNAIEPTPAPILTSTPIPEAKVTEEGDSPKVLKKNTLPSKLIYDNSLAGKMDIDLAKKHLSPFKDNEKKYLYLASYPYRVSKYSLGHFVSDRDAALSYNWLSRQKSISSQHPSGDLLLNDEIRLASRTVHASEQPEISEKWGTLSSILDAFFDRFPIESTHWIPINLQLLESFDKRILRNLFSDDESEDILNFIDQHPDEFTENDNRFRLPEDSKLLIRRYLEVAERSLIPGIEDCIRELWLKDSDSYNSRKAKMMKEKDEISSEIESVLHQVADLKNLRDNLVENFRNPKKNKAEKIYSFTTSKALIVIGLATVGTSLLSESIGSYHAACGLALSLFGFFWPNVETKRPAFAGGDPTNSSLAIETQERSLNHRSRSLGNRVHIMKGNLDAIEKQLVKLGESPPLPYLDSEESED